MSGQRQSPPPQQQQQQHYEDMDDVMGGQDQRPVTIRDLIEYSVQNYIFSLIGDLSSKLFIAPVERLNVMHQTQSELAQLNIHRNLGGVMQAPRALLSIGIGSTIYSGLVFQFWRTTFRCFTSSAFYILEPNLGGIIANPTYFFYVRPFVIDLLNLLCVYPIDTAATMSMADEPSQPQLHESTGKLIQRVLLNPRESLRGFGITALGLVAYRGAIAAVSGVVVNNDWIPNGALNRFLLQNAVLFSCTALVYPFDTVRRRLIVRKAFRDALTNRNKKTDNAAAAAAVTSTAATAAAAASSTTTTTTTADADASKSTAAVDGAISTTTEDESTWQAIKRIHEQEGVPGFFQGLSMRMTRMLGGAAFYGLIQYLEMRTAQME